MHRRMSTIPSIMLALVVGAAACHKNTNVAADTTLNHDLSLATQTGQGQDTLSPSEQPLGAKALNGSTTPAPVAPAPAESHVVHHASSETHHAVHHASGGEVVSSTTTTTTSSGTVVKHTKRDAAIGAAAGAILGATTSRSKVKGGIIGAAVGGILGGVIGNNVDKKKKPE